MTCPPSTNLQEYQNKEFIEFSFCKYLTKRYVWLVKISLSGLCRFKKESGSKLPHSNHSFIQGIIQGYLYRGIEGSQGKIWQVGLGMRASGAGVRQRRVFSESSPLGAQQKQRRETGS